MGSSRRLKRATIRVDARGVLIIVAVVLVVLSVPLTGGSIGNLAHIQIRWRGLAPAVLVAQIAMTDIVDQNVSATLLGFLTVTTYAVLGAFLWANRHIVGMWCIGVGYALNTLVIAANRGVMPASQQALVRSGQITKIGGGGYVNSGLVDHPRLSFLGDVFWIPKGVPLANVFSIGDVVLIVGACWMLHAIGRRRQPAIAPDQTEHDPANGVHLAPRTG